MPAFPGRKNDFELQLEPGTTEEDYLTGGEFNGLLDHVGYVKNALNYDSDEITDKSQVIQAAINDVGNAGGGTVIIPPVTWTLGSKISITKSNIHVVMAPSTTLIMSAAMLAAGDNTAFEFYNPVTALGRSLTGNALPGDSSFRVSPADASAFAAGDWVLLRSKRPANIDYDDAPLGSNYRGEIVQVSAVNTTTGVIQIENALADYYLLADEGNALKLNMLENVGLFGGTIRTNEVSVTGSLWRACVVFRNVVNARTAGVNLKNIFGAAVDFWNVIGGTITRYDIDRVRASISGATSHYGIQLTGATQDCIVVHNRIARTRHSVTFGTHFNSPYGQFSTDAREGVQRNNIIVHNRSTAATSSHFECHSTSEGTLFEGNVALGDWTRGDDLDSLQLLSTPVVSIRGADTIARGNIGQHLRGIGIIVSGPNSRNALIEGNELIDILSRGSSSQLIAAASNDDATLQVDDSSAFPDSGTVVLDAAVTVGYTGKASGNYELTGVTGAPAIPQGAMVIQGSNITYTTRNEAAAGNNTLRVKDPDVLSASGSLTIIGCTVAYTGKSGNNLTGCTGVKGTPAGTPVHYRPTSGDAINFDSTASREGGIIRGNIIHGCDRSAISCSGGQDGMVIEDNQTFDTARRFAVGTITVVNSNRLTLRRNKVFWPNASRAFNIQTSGMCSVEENEMHVRQGHALTSPQFLTVDPRSVVRNNKVILETWTPTARTQTIARWNPAPATNGAYWHANGNNDAQGRTLSVIPGGENTPRSNVIYYNRSGPCSIIVEAVGEVTTVEFNGVLLTPSVGMVLNVGVGDAIKFNAPSTTDTTMASPPSLRITFAD